MRVVDADAGYGNVRVLHDLSLTVQSGSLLAVLGASGSGKTTLLRLLAGFIRPTRGSVWFGDREVAGADAWVPPEKRGVGIVPQEGALFPHLDVAANVGSLGDMCGCKWGLGEGSVRGVCQNGG